MQVPGVGRKPTLLLSRLVVTLRLRPILALITSVDRPRDLPTAVPLEPGEVDLLPQRSWILCHELVTGPDAEAMESRLGRLSHARMLEVERALRYTLALEPV